MTEADVLFLIAGAALSAINAGFAEESWHRGQWWLFRTSSVGVAMGVFCVLTAIVRLAVPA